MHVFLLPLLAGSACLSHGERVQRRSRGTFDDEHQPSIQERNTLLEGHTALQSTPRNAASKLEKMFGRFLLMVGPRSRLHLDGVGSARAARSKGASLHASPFSIRQTKVWSLGDRHSLVERRSGAVVGSAASLNELPMKPSIELGLGPEETLDVVCKGLQDNDTPKADAGVERLHNFLLAAGRVKMAPPPPKQGMQADPGLDYFLKYASDPALGCIVHCTGFKILGHQISPGATRGGFRADRALVTLEVDNTGQETEQIPTKAHFQVLLEQQRYPPFQGVWFIKEFRLSTEKPKYEGVEDEKDPVYEAYHNMLQKKDPSGTSPSPPPKVSGPIPSPPPISNALEEALDKVVTDSPKPSPPPSPEKPSANDPRPSSLPTSSAQANNEITMDEFLRRQDDLLESLRQSMPKTD